MQDIESHGRLQASPQAMPSVFPAASAVMSLSSIITTPPPSPIVPNSVWIAIPAAVALAAGGWLGWQASGSQADRMELLRLQEISTQGRLAAESLNSAIDQLRASALSLRQLRAAGAAPIEPPSPILHWAELEIQGGQIREVKFQSPGGGGAIDWHGVRGAGGETIEESYLNALRSGLSLRELRENGVTLTRVKPDPNRTGEWLALAFAPRDSKTTIVAALVDPAEVFSFFRRIPSRAESSSLRAYLIGTDGRVFAHSQPDYVNADFSRAGIFNDAVRPMMQGTRMSGSGNFRSIDQLPVLASYTRPGNLPLGVVVERTSVEVFSGEAFSAIWQRLAGQLVAVVGGLALLVLICAWRLRRGRPAVVTYDAPVEFSQALAAAPKVEVPAVVPSVNTSTAVAEAASAIVEAWSQGAGAVLAGPPQYASVETTAPLTIPSADREALRLAKEEASVIDEFERDATRLRDPRLVAQRLTGTVARLCYSPTLFFAFHERVRAAILSADGGFTPGDAPAGMSFPIDDALIARIVQAERQGTIASLSDYTPLQKVLSARLGVGHFEAWAITGYGHLGRQGSRPRVLGVLVIVQSGYESASKHESLCRMMRATGLIYENALLSQ